MIKGETIILTTDYAFLGNKHKLACSYPALAKSVQIGQSILCADGSLVLTVLSTDIPAGEITCRIENNASIGERKNMNLPGVLVELPTFTEKDIEGNLHIPCWFLGFSFQWYCRRSCYFILPGNLVTFII